MRHSISFALALAAGSVVAPAYGAITAQWVHAPITPAAIADDPQLANMQSWRLAVTYSEGDWAAAGMRAELPPGFHFYAAGFDDSPFNRKPSPAAVAAQPSLEFTTYVAAAADTGSNNATHLLGGFPEGQPMSFGHEASSIPGTVSVSWGDLINSPPGSYEIAQLTFPIETFFVASPEDGYTSTVNPDQTVSIFPITMVFTNRWLPDADGSWHVADNWQWRRVPGANDIAVIDVGGDQLRTIEYSQGSTYVLGVSSKEHLLLTGGTLTASGLSTASLTISGGTLWHTTVSGAPAVLGPAGGRLHNVTLNQGMIVSHPAAVILESGLTLNGTSPISADTNLRFEGSQTLGGSGTVAFDGRGRIDITAGSQLILGSTLRVEKTGDAPLRINGRFTQATSSRLNLVEGSLINDYTGIIPFAAIRARVISGYNNGAWNGMGISSSTAAADGSFAVGYAEAAALFTAFPATYEGEVIDDTTVIVRLTRAGDADLDGIVNLSDFNRLAANFGSTSAVWSDGDFNYDGIVNLADFNRMAGNFGLAASGADAPTPDDWSALATAVPEPGVGLGGMLLAFTLGRRRRVGVGGE